MYQRIICLLFVFLASMTLTGCVKKVKPIAFENIKSFVLSELETEREVNCSEERVQSFITAYNESEYFRNDYGTTHHFRVDIILSDNSNLTVFGGDAGFQTQLLNEEQHNIHSRTLEKWFADEGNH